MHTLYYVPYVLFCFSNLSVVFDILESLRLHYVRDIEDMRLGCSGTLFSSAGFLSLK